MKILHTSDWHLGKGEGDTSLYEDQKFFIDEIRRIAGAEGVDAVVIAGDVYDNSRVSAEAVKLFDYAMTGLCEDSGIATFVIAGNHDGAEKLSNCSKLLRRSGLYICGELSENVAPVPYRDCELFLLPWITEEKVKSVFPEEKENIQDLTDAYRVVTDKMCAAFTPGKTHVIVSHAFITNAETSTSDKAAEIGTATQVPASVFEGFDYVALGHIHAPQQINPAIRYCGTPMPYSFGKEEKHTKGVVIYDTETNEQKFCPLKLLHRRVTLSGTTAEILNPSENYENCYVRLRISDSYVGLELLSELRKLYPHILEVEGKSFESENASVTMTLQEFEELEANPVAVFQSFCREEMEEEPDEHTLQLFEAAVKKAEEEMER